jgi:hypothetical protein
MLIVCPRATRGLSEGRGVTWRVHKELETAPKGLKVMQVTALKDYRVALLVTNLCVWLLRAYLRQGKNQRDIERAVEAAKRISEEER